MERRGLASATPRTSPKLALRKGCLCLGTEALTQQNPCQAVLVLDAGRLRVAVAPHCWRSWRVARRGLVDLEASDIAARRKERGEMQWMDLLTWSNLKCEKNTPFTLPVLSKTFNSRKRSRTSKVVTLRCLHTTNNNWAAISEGVSCTTLFSWPVFPCPHPWAIWFKPGPAGIQS